MQAGQASRAVEVYRRGLRTYPSFAGNYLALGSLYLSQDDPAKALPYFQEALPRELSPEDRTRAETIVRDLRRALAPAPAP